jgi:hypothetical protein
MGHLFSKDQLPSARAGMAMARELAETAEDAGISSLVRPPP